MCLSRQLTDTVQHSLCMRSVLEAVPCAAFFQLLCFCRSAFPRQPASDNLFLASGGNDAAVCVWDVTQCCSRTDSVPVPMHVCPALVIANSDKVRVAVLYTVLYAVLYSAQHVQFCIRIHVYVGQHVCCGMLC